MIRDEHVQVVVDAFLAGLIMVLGSKLFGVYLYGALAFPGPFPISDIDFHVIITGPLTDDERSALEQLHERLALELPPLGGEFDGFYLLLSDTRGISPPRSEMWTRATDHSWALHCEHIRAGRCIILYGPDPGDLYPRMSWSEIENALNEELEYVKAHLQDFPAYCILNLCRLIYSFETGDVVVSKAATSDWALEKLPDWKQLITCAKRSYIRQADKSDDEYMNNLVESFYHFACARIREVSGRG